MPYIKSSRKDELALGDVAVKELTPGDVNYLITKFIKEWWDVDPHYSRICEITGVLENVKQEFYARIARPYEDEKIAENGDVY